MTDVKIEAVLFDLGNTLWHIPERPPVNDIRRETVRRIFSVLQEWGVEPEDELRFLGRDIRLAMGEADRAAYESDCISPHFPGVVQEVVKSKGLDITLEQGEQLWDAWNLEGSFFGRRLFDDAMDTLTGLRGMGLRLGCVTNRPFAGPSFVEEVEAHGLADLMDVMSISCDIGYMKPHPKIYQHALEELGVAPQNTMMVGDSLRADVAGAQTLGMTGVWRKHHAIKERVQDVEPDYAIDELSELLTLPCLSTNGSSAVDGRPRGG